MTDAELNEAVARRCGWTWSVPHYTHAKRWEVTLCYDGGHWKPEDSAWAGFPPVFDGCYKNYYAVPNYAHSIDAVRAEVVKMGERKIMAFENALDDIRRRKPLLVLFCELTARDWAEALLEVGE
jgi:hypothetical protein